MNDARRVRDAVEGRIDAAAASDHPRSYADSDEPTDDPAVLQRETFREIDGVVAGPGVSAMTAPMWKGLIIGAVLGGALGAVVLAPMAFLVEMGDLALWARLLIVGGIGAVAGGTIGAHYWGGRLPELSGESLDADNTPSAGSSLADPHTDAHGR